MEGGGRLAPGTSARLTTAEGRRFGGVLGIAFLALAALLWWRGRLIGATVAAGLGAVLLAGGLLVPERLGPVQQAWLRLGTSIGRVTTPVFLAIVYFLVLTPTGLILRLIGYRPLTRARTPSTVWIVRAHGQGRRGDLHRQF